VYHRSNDFIADKLKDPSIVSIPTELKLIINYDKVQDLKFIHADFHFNLIKAIRKGAIL
jgi:hypothetical protein